MHSGPAEILQKTEAVFTGTFERGPRETAFVKVHDVLWQRNGALKGRKRVQVSHGKIDYGLDVADGVAAVFFLGTLDELTYVAEPRQRVAHKHLGSVPLQMRGFYFDNAHLTTPAVMTLNGIKGALKTGVFKDRFSVSMAFPSATGLSVDPSLTFSGEIVDGKVTSLKGPIKGSILDAKMLLSGWNHAIDLTLVGEGARVEAAGRFERLNNGIMVGTVVSQGPVLNASSLERRLQTGLSPLSLTVSRGKGRATLTLTDEAEGRLEPGLGVSGPLVRIGRFDGEGHHNQYGEGPRVEPSTQGWHLEIATSSGPLWITMPLSTVDAVAAKMPKDSVSLQTQLLAALMRARQAAVFSGALTGAGTVSLNP